MSDKKNASNSGIGKKRKLQQAIEYLVAHPKASTDDVRANTGVSSKTVQNARKKGYDMGVLPRSPYDRVRRDPLENPAVIDTEGAEDLMEAVTAAVTGDERTPLDIDESKRVLAGIARNGSNPDSLRIQAITASARLDQISGSVEVLGPRPALNRADWVDKTRTILDVAGLDIAVDALVRAYPGDELDHFPAQIVAAAAVYVEELAETARLLAIEEEKEKNRLSVHPLEEERPPNDENPENEA